MFPGYQGAFPACKVVLTRCQGAFTGWLWEPFKGASESFMDTRESSVLMEYIAFDDFILFGKGSQDHPLLVNSLTSKGLIFNSFLKDI